MTLVALAVCWSPWAPRSADAQLSAAPVSGTGAGRLAPWVAAAAPPACQTRTDMLPAHVAAQTAALRRALLGDPSPDPGARRDAAEQLGAWCAPALPVALEALGDPDPMTRQLAVLVADSLGRLARAACPRLLAMAAAPVPQDWADQALTGREWAVRAVGRVGCDAPAVTGVLLDVIARLRPEATRRFVGNRSGRDNSDLVEHAGELLASAYDGIAAQGPSARVIGGPRLDSLLLAAFADSVFLPWMGTTAGPAVRVRAAVANAVLATGLRSPVILAALNRTVFDTASRLAVRWGSFALTAPGVVNPLTPGAKGSQRLHLGALYARLYAAYPAEALSQATWAMGLGARAPHTATVEALRSHGFELAQALGRPAVPAVVAALERDLATIARLAPRATMPNIPPAVRVAEHAEQALARRGVEAAFVALATLGPEAAAAAPTLGRVLESGTAGVVEYRDRARAALASVRPR